MYCPVQGSRGRIIFSVMQKDIKMESVLTWKHSQSFSLAATKFLKQHPCLLSMIKT